MRLHETQALVLRSVLVDEIVRAIHRRADARDNGEDSSVTSYNARIATLRSMVRELDRVLAERRWGDYRTE